MGRAAQWVGCVRRNPSWLAGAVGSLVVAAVLFSRYSWDAPLNRDEAIYVYGGQRLADGVPPYLGVFDPKTPLSTLLCGAAVWLARLVGRGDLSTVRALFFLCAVLAVLATYALGARLFRSVPAGLTAAAVLASFSCFAVDALGGPNAKTPGVLLLVLSMWLTVRADWFVAGVAGGLAFLVWQPLIAYPFVTVMGALLLTSGPRRVRSGALALGGAALPVLVVSGYLASVGALRAFLDAAFVFPLVGVHRGDPKRPPIVQVALTALEVMGWGGVVFLLGLVLVVGAAVLHLVRHRREPGRGLDAPLVWVGLGTLALQLGYAGTDFQGYPDLYPLLPYAGLGFGALVAWALARAGEARTEGAVRAVRWTVLTGLVALVVTAAVTFTQDPPDTDGLARERVLSCAVEHSLTPGTRLWSLGNPVPLVLAHRRNPDRFVYLNSGVGQWKIDKHGGLDGWQEQIRSVRPSVVIFNSWNGDAGPSLVMRVRALGYAERFVGPWRAFVTPEVIRHAARRGVQLTAGPTDTPVGPDGRPLTETSC